MAGGQVGIDSWRYRHAWPHWRRARERCLILLIAPVLTLSTSPLPLIRGLPAQAQPLRPEVRDPFLADPLEDLPRDPLLPSPPVPRPLSPLELFALEQDLEQLAVEAATLAQAGQPDNARRAWMREVRLRRLLGLDPELTAMDRVAQNLRTLNASQDCQLLSARLAIIQTRLAINQPTDRDRLETIARTYATLGNVEAATALRQSLAETALARGDRAEHQSQLEQVASLYADWFYFDQAAATYAELVQLAQTNRVLEDEIRFLQGQIHNLQYAQRLQEALTTQQYLITRYQSDPSLWPRIAELQYHMAQNYHALGQLDTASRQYQAAYTNAIANQQFDVAADTIRALAKLYRELGRWPDVSYLYQQLLLVERQASNAYGLMDTFDQLGQLYEQARERDRALMAYREGLILARHLGYRQAYFEEQINRLTRQQAKTISSLTLGAIQCLVSEFNKILKSGELAGNSADNT